MHNNGLKEDISTLSISFHAEPLDRLPLEQLLEEEGITDYAHPKFGVGWFILGVEDFTRLATKLAAITLDTFLLDFIFEGFHSDVFLDNRADAALERLQFVSRFSEFEIEGDVQPIGLLFDCYNEAHDLIGRYTTAVHLDSLPGQGSNELKAVAWYVQNHAGGDSLENYESLAHYVDVHLEELGWKHVRNFLFTN